MYDKKIEGTYTYGTHDIYLEGKPLVENDWCGDFECRQITLMEKFLIATVLQHWLFNAIMLRIPHAYDAWVRWEWHDNELTNWILVIGHCVLLSGSLKYSGECLPKWIEKLLYCLVYRHIIKRKKFERFLRWLYWDEIPSNESVKEELRDWYRKSVYIEYHYENL